MPTRIHHAGLPVIESLEVSLQAVLWTLTLPSWAMGAVRCFTPLSWKVLLAKVLLAKAQLLGITLPQVCLAYCIQVDSA